MDSSIDFTQHTETELVDMFGRLDPRYAPAECARLSKYLAEHGYIVTDGTTGPGTAIPSPTKLQASIGSPHPIEWHVDFGKRTSGMLGPAANEFGFVGAGTIKTDGISVWICGRDSNRGLEIVQLSCNKIANVEAEGRFVRFSYNADKFDVDSVGLWLRDNAAVAAFVAIMPTRRTQDFRPQAKADVEFQTKLVAQSPEVPVTIGLITTNVIVFVITLVAGAEWILPGDGRLQIAWGSNFAPYTSHGEWWRLLTSMFIHFGLLHIVLNMMSLAMFGPIVERLYGSINFFLLYIFSGITGGLASIACQPTINTAGASGFLIGLVAARPVTGGKSFSRTDLQRSLQLVSMAAVILAVGFWLAQRAPARM